MKKAVLLFSIVLIALCGFGQNQFIHVASKANSSGNGDGTLLDIPDLNNNPEAIIMVTPILENELNLNPHPIGVFYFKKQWNIFNLDQRALPAGAKFKVEYVIKPDPGHFQYAITKENLQKDGCAFIDNPVLNDRPHIQFHCIVSWLPEIWPGIPNRDEVSIRFNPDAGRWYISNLNKKPLFARVVYNIIIFSEENPLPGQGKEEPISKPDPETNKKRADTIPVISKITPKTKIKDPVPIIKGPVDKKPISPKKSIVPAYDFSKVFICIEKAPAGNLPPKKPSPPAIPKIKPNGELEPLSTVIQPLSGVTDRMWTPCEHISVGFYSGASTIITNKVKQHVKTWETTANIVFDFITDVRKAQIRVGFVQDNTSWSWIGRDVLSNPNDEQTMNFGWFTTATEDSEFRRTILHEFGHALGFIHEHQAPLAAIPWDSAKVYTFFGGPSINWDTATIDHNIFSRFAETTTNSSAYDRLSIMHYFFPADLTTDGSSFTWNTTLSAVDKTFAKQVYPFPPTPPTSTGILRTGDDCDEIDFTVEYNISPASEIEFILKPGYDHHNALVNWWKMIGIPSTGFVNITALQLNTSRTIQANTIDRSRPITFGKAKVLGVHTGLAFTWAPWPAIVGGCRVTFVWRRDSCN